MRSILLTFLAILFAASTVKAEVDAQSVVR
jgi:hypothetical protein